MPVLKVHVLDDREICDDEQKVWMTLQQMLPVKRGAGGEQNGGARVVREAQEHGERARYIFVECSTGASCAASRRTKPHDLLLR